jgi:inner membrane protein
LKWRNHKAVTLAAVYAASGLLTASVCAMIGSVLPDILECRGVIEHRTITHWPWLWLGGMFLFWTIYKTSGTSPVYFYFLMCACAGALLHVAEDALSNGGVPVFSPYGEKTGFGIYKTCSLGEELSTLGMVAIFSLFGWVRGYFDADHILQQLADAGSFVDRLLHG